MRADSGRPGHARRAACVSAAAAWLLVAASGAAAQRFHLGVQVSQGYTSNLFHEQARRIPLFSTLTGPWQRYEGMQGPSDFVTEPGLEAGVTFKLAKRQRLTLSLGAEYAIHARNPIADYLTLQGELRYKLGKRDSLSYQASYVPTRFVKNYAYNFLFGTGLLFSHAERLELENELTYSHAWTKRVESELSVALDLGRFDAPFENRDSNEYRAMLATRYAPLHAIELELGLEFGATRTPGGVEHVGGEIVDARYVPIDVAIDRSHHDVEPHLELTLDLPSRFAAMLGFAARLRQFETDEPDNDSYYDRYDRRLKLSAEVSKGFGRRLELALRAGYTDSNAYRAKPSKDADDYGYEELTLALELSLLL